MSLASEPSTAVAINTDFIGDAAQTLVIKSKVFRSGQTIELEDGTILFRVEKEKLSASHRTHVVDARKEQELFEMRKQTWHDRYYAERPDGSGGNLFDIDIKSKLMSGTTVTMTFPNAANSGNVAQLECKVHTFKSNNTVTLQGQTVAEVESHCTSMKTYMRLVPGIDPLPVIAMYLALTDLQASQGAAASAGASGGSGGAGA